MQDASDSLVITRAFGNTRYTFNIRPSAVGTLEVTRLTQTDGGEGQFDDVRTDTMVGVSTNHVDWFPAYDTFPAVRVTGTDDISTLDPVYGVASETLRYSLNRAPPWLQIDDRVGQLSGTAETQDDHVFDIVAAGQSSREVRTKTMTLPTADVRIVWDLPETTDLRPQYSSTGQVATWMDASNPSGNTVIYTIGGDSVPAGVAITSDGHFAASRRIGLAEAIVRATVARGGFSTSEERTLLLEPASFLNTALAGRAVPLQIDQPDAAKHPTTVSDATGDDFARLHAQSVSGFAGVADVSNTGWSIIARYRSRSGGLLVDVPGAYRIEVAEPASAIRAQFTAFGNTFQPGSEPGYVLDGNPYTQWHSKFSGDGIEDLPATVGIDMKRSLVVSGLHVTPRHPVGQDFRGEGLPKNCAVEVSDDFATWTHVFSGTAWSDVADRSKRTFFFAPVHTRYVRFVIESNVQGHPTWAAISGLDVLFETPSVVLTGVTDTVLAVGSGPTVSVPAETQPSWSCLGVASSDTVSTTDDGTVLASGVGALAMPQSALPDAPFTIGYSADSNDTVHDADISHMLVYDRRLTDPELRKLSAAITHGVVVFASDAAACGILAADTATPWGTPPRELLGYPYIDPGAGLDGPITVEARQHPLRVLALAVGATTQAPSPLPGGDGVWENVSDVVGMLGRWQQPSASGAAAPGAAYAAQLPAGQSFEFAPDASGNHVYVFNRDLEAAWAESALKDLRPYYGPDGTVSRRLEMATLSTSDEPLRYETDLDESYVTNDGRLTIPTSESASVVHVFANVVRDGIRNTVPMRLELLNANTRALFSGGDGSEVLQWTPDGDGVGVTFETDAPDSGYYLARFGSSNDTAYLRGGPFTGGPTGTTIVMRIKQADVDNPGAFFYCSGPTEWIARLSSSTVTVAFGSHIGSATLSVGRGNWVVLAFVLRADSMEVFEDGQSILTQSHAEDDAAAEFTDTVLCNDIGSTGGLGVLESDVSHARVYASALDAAGALASTASMPLTWTTQTDLGLFVRGESLSWRLRASVAESFRAVHGGVVDKFEVVVHRDDFGLSDTGADVLLRPEQPDAQDLWARVQAGEFNRVYSREHGRVYKVEPRPNFEHWLVFGFRTFTRQDMRSFPVTGDTSGSREHDDVPQTWYAYHTDVDDGEVDIADTSLPAGLAFDSSTGTISGTPSISAPQTVNVEATSVSGLFSVRTFTINVTSRPEWETFTLPTIATYRQFSIPVFAKYTANGGYSVVDGSFASGVSVSSDGEISGTTNFNGTLQARIRAISRDDPSIYSEVVLDMLTVYPPSWLTHNRQDFGQNVAKTIQLDAIHADTYFVADDDLPGGITLTSSGLLQGTPPTPSTRTLTRISAVRTGVVNGTTDRVFDFKVYPEPVWQTGAALTSGVRGVPLNIGLNATHATSYEIVSPNSGVYKLTIHVHRDDLGTSTRGTFLYVHIGGDTATMSNLLSSGLVNRVYTSRDGRVYKIRYELEANGYARAYISTFTATDMASRPFTGSTHNIHMTWYMFYGDIDEEYTVPNTDLPPGVTLDTQTGHLGGVSRVIGDHEFTIRAHSYESTRSDRTFTLNTRGYYCGMDPAQLDASVCGVDVLDQADASIRPERKMSSYTASAYPVDRFYGSRNDRVNGTINVPTNGLAVFCRFRASNSSDRERQFFWTGSNVDFRLKEGVVVFAFDNGHQKYMNMAQPQLVNGQPRWIHVGATTEGSGSDRKWYSFLDGTWYEIESMRGVSPHTGSHGLAFGRLVGNQQLSDWEDDEYIEFSHSFVTTAMSRSALKAYSDGLVE